MENQYNYQKYLLKAIAAEKRYWTLIDNAYDDIVDKVQLVRTGHVLNTINELPPRALLRGLKIIALINKGDQSKVLDLQANLFQKIFRKQIEYCNKQGENLAYLPFLKKFYTEKMSTEELLKLSAFYIHMRRCMRLPEDTSDELEEVFASAEALDAEYNIEKTSKKTAIDWLKAHHEPMTLNELQYEQDIFTAEFKPLEEISKRENIPIRAYENYKLTKNDVAEMIDIANAMKVPYNINRYLTYSYIIKSLARYAAECKDAYLDLALSPEASPTKTIKKHLAKAEADIAELNKRIDGKQEQLNDLQQRFNRQQKVLMQAQDENTRLEEYTALLERQLEAAGNRKHQEAEKNVPKVNLDGAKVVVIGGHDSWQQKVKEQFPSFTYISADSLNFDTTLTRTADVIVFNVLHCTHGLFYRLRENCDKDKIIYIASNNIDNLKRALAGENHGK